MTRSGLLRITPLALAAWAGLVGTVMADDWMVDRLRGEVEVQVGGATVFVLPIVRFERIMASVADGVGASNGD